MKREKLSISNDLKKGSNVDEILEIHGTFYVLLDGLVIQIYDGGLQKLARTISLQDLGLNSKNLDSSWKICKINVDSKNKWLSILVSNDDNYSCFFHKLESLKTEPDSFFGKFKKRLSNSTDPETSTWECLLGKNVRNLILDPKFGSRSEKRFIYHNSQKIILQSKSWITGQLVSEIHSSQTNAEIIQTKWSKFRTSYLAVIDTFAIRIFNVKISGNPAISTYASEKTASYIEWVSFDEVLCLFGTELCLFDFNLQILKKFEILKMTRLIFSVEERLLFYTQDNEDKRSYFVNMFNLETWKKAEALSHRFEIESKIFPCSNFFLVSSNDQNNMLKYRLLNKSEELEALVLRKEFQTAITVCETSYHVILVVDGVVSDSLEKGDKQMVESVIRGLSQDKFSSPYLSSDIILSNDSKLKMWKIMIKKFIRFPEYQDILLNGLISSIDLNKSKSTEIYDQFLASLLFSQNFKLLFSSLEIIQGKFKLDSFDKTLRHFTKKVSTITISDSNIFFYLSKILIFFQQQLYVRCLNEFFIRWEKIEANVLSTWTQQFFRFFDSISSFHDDNDFVTLVINNADKVVEFDLQKGIEVLNNCFSEKYFQRSEIYSLILYVLGLLENNEEAIFAYMRKLWNEDGSGFRRKEFVEHHEFYFILLKEHEPEKLIEFISEAEYLNKKNAYENLENKHVDEKIFLLSKMGGLKNLETALSLIVKDKKDAKLAFDFVDRQSMRIRSKLCESLTDLASEESVSFQLGLIKFLNTKDFDVLRIMENVKNELQMADLVDVLRNTDEAIVISSNRIKEMKVKVAKLEAQKLHLSKGAVMVEKMNFASIKHED